MYHIIELVDMAAGRVGNTEIGIYKSPNLPSSTRTFLACEQCQRKTLPEAKAAVRKLYEDCEVVSFETSRVAPLGRTRPIELYEETGP